MAKFCGNCGYSLEDDARFCPECGTKTQEAPEAAPEEKKPEPVITPKAQNVPPVKAQVTQPNPKPVAPQPVVPQPVVPQPVVPQPAPTPAPVDKSNKIVKTGTFFGFMLLFAIPVIGFICAIIFSFAPKSKSLKNFARATLIWMIIGLVITAIIVILCFVMTTTIINFLQNTIDEYSYEYGYGATNTPNQNTAADDTSSNTSYYYYYDYSSVTEEADKIINEFDYSALEEIIYEMQ